MAMTAVLAMVAVEFGVRLIALVGLERMPEFFLVTGLIAMGHAVHNDIGCPFQAHEEQGDDQALAYERAHDSLAYPRFGLSGRIGFTFVARAAKFCPGQLNHLERCAQV